MAKKAPLAPEGYTIENRYTLRPPFGPRGVLAKGAPRPPKKIKLKRTKARATS